MAEISNTNVLMLMEVPFLFSAIAKNKELQTLQLSQEGLSASSDPKQRCMISFLQTLHLPTTKYHHRFTVFQYNSTHYCKK